MVTWGAYNIVKVVNAGAAPPATRPVTGYTNGHMN
jgi:hypothetical protein